MKRFFFFTASVLFSLSTAASGDPDGEVTIVCEQESSPSFTNIKLYKTPPKTDREHAMNIVMGNGVGALLIEKPKRIFFVLNESKNRIERTDGTTPFGGAKISFDRKFVRAVSQSQVMKLDRRTGEMAHTFFLSEETISEWKRKHGGTPPDAGTWIYQCKTTEAVF